MAVINPVFRDLGSLVAVSIGTPLDINHLESAAVLIGGTFVGTVDVEVSFDGGVTWVAHPSFASITAPKVAALAMRVQQIRANCTAFTSGTIEIKLSGQDEG